MSPRKIWIILRSEYRRRVRSTAFILTTLLMPFGLLLLMTLPGVIGYFAATQSGTSRVAVADRTGGPVVERLQAQADARYQFEVVDAPADSLRRAVRDGIYDGYLELPAALLDGEGEAAYYVKEGGGVISRTQLSDLVDDAVQQVRLAQVDAPPEVTDILGTSVAFTSRTLTEEGATESNTFLYSAVGYGMAFLIYFVVFFYGQYVMQGVIEEKSSRVVELIVSSARPFELLMGKVLGIGAMGLTQMVVWGAMILGGTAAAGSVAALFVDPSMLDLPEGASQAAVREAVGTQIPSVDPGLVAWFILFFLGGYLLYASLYAAVGSAVEQMQDAQNLLLPLTLPLLIPLMFIFFIIESPNATLSVVLSMVPFFAPILMITRLAITDVALWQPVVAYLLLAGTFVGAIWASARIYRVGILMYGKTPSLRELARWITYS